MGKEKGSFPHSKGANLAEVGCFFPSVEPKTTMAPAIPPARIKLTAIPMYSFTRRQPCGQYTLICGLFMSRVPGWVPGLPEPGFPFLKPGSPFPGTILDFHDSPAAVGQVQG